MVGERVCDSYRTRTRSTKNILVRRHTSIPAPRVLSWSSDGSNRVGAEYIVMEKAAGVPLSQVWGTMNEFDKLQLIKNLTNLESELANIEFPAYGGLYLRMDMSRSIRLLDGDIDPSQSFCIGPSCDWAFDTDMTPELNRGPCALSTLFIRCFTCLLTLQRGFNFRFWSIYCPAGIVSNIKRRPKPFELLQRNYRSANPPLGSHNRPYEALGLE